jgi:putative FmdB family regulatory protein
MRQTIRGNDFGKRLRRKTLGGRLMPKYEYACTECDIDYEKERSITEADPGYHCDKCGYALQRVFNSFGLSFKGGGFYSTRD